MKEKNPLLVFLASTSPWDVSFFLLWFEAASMNQSQWLLLLVAYAWFTRHTCVSGAVTSAEYTTAGVHNFAVPSGTVYLWVLVNRHNK